MLPLILASSIPAVLTLEDGFTFVGLSLGVSSHTVGELVFNTAMTGYQEIITDPSYNGQIVVFTYPHIGNTGVNVEDNEANKSYIAGLIVKDIPRVVSSFQAVYSLTEYCITHNIVVISNIDTRKLTRILRKHGAQNGAIVADEKDLTQAKIKALNLARSSAKLTDVDLVKIVSTKKIYSWNIRNSIKNNLVSTQKVLSRFRIATIDYGVKHSILRMLTQRGCDVMVLPACTTASSILSLKLDGVFLSNGPGDPEFCDYATFTARVLIESGIPIFGICLGHQIIALASGAKTLKMKFGHHGANHPVQDLNTKKVMITSQNHSFSVDAATLPNNCRVTHISLFDGSIQGLIRVDRPVFCFQGHPEASPGPHDGTLLFDKFITMMENKKHAKA